MYDGTLYHTTVRVGKRKIIFPHQETNFAMSVTRTVEVFTAGCPLCEEILSLVQSLACGSCDVQTVSLQEEAGSRRAEEVGVTAVPAVAVNGTLANCCQGRGVEADDLRAAGIGDPL